jgi:hypothetical protein
MREPAAGDAPASCQGHSKVILLGSHASGVAGARFALPPATRCGLRTLLI